MLSKGKLDHYTFSLYSNSEIGRSVCHELIFVSAIMLNKYQCINHVVYIDEEK